MKKIIPIILACLVAIPSAFAHGWHHDHRGYYRHDHDGNVAAAVIGGAVLGYLLGQQTQRQMYVPSPRAEYYQSQPIEHCERTWVWDPYLHRQIEQTRCYRVR